MPVDVSTVAWLTRTDLVAVYGTLATMAFYLLVTAVALFRGLPVEEAAVGGGDYIRLAHCFRTSRKLESHIGPTNLS